MSGSAGVPTDASIRSILNHYFDEFEKLSESLIKAFAIVAQTGTPLLEEVYNIEER